MTLLEQGAPRGLKGVVVTDTALSDVRGLEGFYHYRQYSAVDLAAMRTLEDVWYLLFEGGLPSAAQHQAFTTEVATLRALPPVVADLLGPIAAAGGTNPLDGLRTAVSLLAGAE